MSIILGGVCGGPVGMLVAKAIHSGLLLHIGLEAGGVAGGAWLGGKTYRTCHQYRRNREWTWTHGEDEELLEYQSIQKYTNEVRLYVKQTRNDGADLSGNVKMTRKGKGKRVRFNLQPEYRVISDSETDDGSETGDSIQASKPFAREGSVEQDFQRLVQIVENDPYLAPKYRNIIAQYHLKVSEGEDSLDTGVWALERFTALLLEAYQPLVDFRTIDLPIYAERILMMSLHTSLWEATLRETVEENQSYLEKRSKCIEYPDIPKSILDSLNQMQKRVTAKSKITTLLQVYHLLDTYAISHLKMAAVSCDILIPMFTSTLALSELRTPFAELLFMESFLPENLIGKESYVLSTWKAACYYITQTV